MTYFAAHQTATKIINGEMNIAPELQGRFLRAARLLLEGVTDENDFEFAVRDSKIDGYNA